jgi:hypothetical protein
MKILYVPLLALTALVMLAAPLRADDEHQSLVTVVTSAEPQTQLMAMVLTMQAVKQGARGHVLLCGPGGDLALKEAPASATASQKPKGMSPQGLMRTIMEQTQTSVQVCALYLPNKGLDESALIDGVSVAAPPAMAKRLIADDTRIMGF